MGLPLLHEAIRPAGFLAVCRHLFGDDSVSTPFRDRVQEIVDRRGSEPERPSRPDARPTMGELVEEGWFEAVHSEEWPWSIDLRSEEVRRLFRTFSDWRDHEVEEAVRAADACGGVVTEHYRTSLHVARRR